MHLLLLISGLCALPFTLSQCQDGWSQFGSRCFRVNTTLATWSVSETNCANMGGHLASVHSSTEYTFIQDLVQNATNSSTETWIGATDGAEEGRWVWTDGSTFDYTDWNPSYQPDNGVNSEDCLEMNFPVNWNDVNCNSFYPSVCAITAETTTTTTTTTTAQSTAVEGSTSGLTSSGQNTGCKNGWSQFGSRCFRVFTTTATWKISELNCVNMGGHLASVHSSSEYSFIQDLVLNATNSNSRTWLGGSDVLEEGLWVWSDGTTFDYINWSTGQPDNNGVSENCVDMTSAANWNDVHCTKTFPSVCAKTASTTTASPTGTTSECQNGWSQFESRCFTVITTAASFSDSELNCVNMGGHLASVHSSLEYTFIQNLVLNASNSSTDTWLGGTDAAQEGVWVWTDGSAFDYFTWGFQQPDNGVVAENCIALISYVWMDERCSTFLPSVCAIPAEEITSSGTYRLIRSISIGCKNGWSLYGYLCFKVFTTPASWINAERNCVAMGGHLASVQSSSKNGFIHLLVSTAKINTLTWLGGTDAKQERVWAWSDGAKFNFNRWFSGQPDNGGATENCLEMDDPVNWNDLNCNMLFPSVCATAVLSTTTVASNMKNTTSTSPENFLIMQLKMMSNQDLMASNSSQLLLQQLKGKLIDSGLPSNFTLRLTSINKKTP